MVSIVPSQCGSFIGFHGFLPNVSCGITTKKFGDCSTPSLKNNGGKKISGLLTYTRSNYFFKATPDPKSAQCNVQEIAWQENIDNYLPCNSLVYAIPDKFDSADEPSIPLLLSSTGDCPTVLFSDGELIATCHDGWQGVEMNFVKLTLLEIEKIYEINLKTLKALIWPGICGYCYEVGDEFREKFPHYFSLNHVHLADVIKDQLLDYGIRSHNIACADSYCSCCHRSDNDEPLFYSSRRGDAQRNVVFIAPKSG